MKRATFLCSIILAAVMAACNSSTRDQIKEGIDIADGVPRKEIDRSITGVNAFFNDSRYGSTSQQYNEITRTLGIRHIRVLMSWNDAVQPSPGAAPNFGLYDEIVSSAPAGTDLLVILTDVPSWMANSSNWDDGNPRLTFVRRWVEPVVRRYGSSGRISAWQIWNEPNFAGRSDNAILGLDTDPNNFIELMGHAYPRCKDLAPGKLVLNGATTAINQNFPGTLDYNRALRDGGVTAFTDVFAIHYYGRQYENVVRGGGVQDFLESIGEPIWVTESGAQGTTEQLKYVEQTWPFLKDKIPGIARFYYYQMYDTNNPATTYGLRNPSTTAPVSDLYLYLRDGVR
jgi:hypothetical protein